LVGVDQGPEAVVDSLLPTLLRGEGVLENVLCLLEVHTSKIQDDRQATRAVLSRNLLILKIPACDCAMVALQLKYARVAPLTQH